MDETMLDTDVVDLEGNLKGAFPSELRYAWNARLGHCMSAILHFSFFHAILHCKDSTRLCEEQEDHGGSEHYFLEIDFASKSR